MGTQSFLIRAPHLGLLANIDLTLSINTTNDTHY